MSRQSPRTPIPERMRKAPVSVTTALRIGVGRERLRGADLAAPFHGVRAPAMPHDAESAARAYATRMPRWASFYGKTAAQLIGAPLPSRLRDVVPLEVVVPAGERAPRRNGVRGWSRALAGEPMLEDGLRICAAEDLWCGMAERLALPELVALGDHLIRPSIARTDRRSLERAVRRVRRGGPRLRQALELLDGRAESGPESDVRVALVLAGVEGIEPNLWVTARGRRYRIDLAIPRLRVAIEYHGDYHRDPEQWRRDLVRRAALEAAGWTVVELCADDLRHPDRIVALVRAAIARASR